MNRCGNAAFAALMAASWSALLLAEFGRFNALPCLLVALVAALVVWKKSPPFSDPHLKWAVLIALASLLLTLPPGETILGGWDPGVYVNTAAAVSRDGSLVWNMPEYAGFSADERPLVVRQYGGISGPSGGVWFLPDGRVSPQFFHLYPSLLAIAWALGGVRAALFVNPALNVLSILAFYLCARRVVGGVWALGACIALALNPAQIWQATFPTSELLTQLLFLGGLTNLAIATEDKNGRWFGALLAGTAFGSALLCRYDSIMFLIPMAAALVLFWADLPTPRRLAFALIALLPLAGQALWHQTVFSPYYRPAGNLVLAAVLAGSAGLATCLALLHLPPISLRRRLAPYAVRLRSVAALAVVLAAAFAWFIRPRMPVDPIFGGPESGNMLILADLFGPVGLLLALAGVVVLIVKSDAAWQKAWIAAAIAATAVLVAKLFNEHYLMWVSRRFVPVTVPFLCLALAVAARATPRLGPALLAVVLALNLPATISVARSRDWPGLVKWYEQLAPKIPEGAALFCDQPGFASPLRFMFDKKSFELQSRDRVVIERLFLNKLRAGDDVWFLSMSGPIASTNFTLLEEGRFPLASHVRADAKRGVPRTTKPRGGDFVLYRATRPP